MSTIGFIVFIIFFIVVLVAYVRAIVVPLGEMADHWKEEEDSMRAEFRLRYYLRYLRGK